MKAVSFVSTHFDSVRPSEADELSCAAEPGTGGSWVGHVRVLETAHPHRVDEVGRGELKF